MTIRASDHLPHEMTEEQYRRLPEGVAREIEVVHGHVIVCESPVPEHNRVARRLAARWSSCRALNRASESRPI